MTRAAQENGAAMPDGGGPVRIGVDLGTGSLKLVAYTGSESFSASRAYRINSPAAGVAETDPEEWVAALRDAWASVRAQLSAAGRSAEVASIGVAGQMHGFVPVGSDGAPLRDAILWADLRGGEYVEEFGRRLADCRDSLLNAPAAGLTAPIIMWLQRREPETYRRAAHFLFPKDYLRFRLTGTVVTDPGDASASLLYDFGERGWSARALAALGIDPEKLPPIKASFSPAGAVTARAAAETGLPEGCPVAVGSADTSCALYGSGLFAKYFAARAEPAESDWRSPRSAQVSIGTGAQVIVPVRGLPAYDRSLNFFESCVPGVGYRMAAMLNGGIALEWVVSALGSGWDTFYADLDAGRAGLPDDLLFLPHLAGERSPYMNTDARGAWIGIGLHHGKNDLLAGALLGVACSVRLGMEALGVSRDARVSLVGGSSRYPAWMRIVSSVLERPIEVCSLTDVSSRGSASIGATVARHGGFTPADIPAEPETTRVEGDPLPWMGRYYARFKGCFDALYGEAGAWLAGR